MTITADPSTSALLVLRYQNGIVRPDGVFAFSGTAAQVEKHKTLEKTAGVLQAVRARGMMVVYVNIAYRPGFPELKKPTYPLIESIQERNAFLRGSWDADIPEEIAAQPSDIIVINFDSSGFSHTDLDCILRANDVKQLFIAGVATNWVVESTTRYGAELGYDIYVLEDCCQAFTDELHAFAIEQTLPFYATIMQSSDFLASLGAATEPSPVA